MPQTTRTVYITATNRLSQSLRLALLSPHQEAVVTNLPQVLTLTQWWAEFYQQALMLEPVSVLEDIGLPTRILSDFESLLIWEHQVQQALQREEARKLLNVSTTAKQMQQAWQWWGQWCQLDPVSGSLQSVESFDWGGMTPELALFQECLAGYLETLEAENLWDQTMQGQKQVQLLQRSQSVPLAQHYRWVGFDERPPFAEALFSELQARSCDVEDMPPPMEGEGKQSIYTALDPLEEVRQAVAWSLQQLVAQMEEERASDGPSVPPTFCLVAPAVEDYAEPFASAVEESLLAYPDAVREQLAERWGLFQPEDFYNVSLGQPLSDFPLIRNALDTLTLLLQPHQSHPYALWSRWLTSAYTVGERAERHQLDVKWRQLQWANLKWPHLLNGETVLPVGLAQVLKDFQETSIAPLGAEKFVETARQCLQQAQWHQGVTLDSELYQQKQAFEKALQNFATFYDVKQKRPLRHWLTLLERYLQSQLFQPETLGHPPIQLMGMLEAGGQTFETLWVLGVHEEAWPRPANPNPFLPIELQRSADMPHSSADKELHYAKQVTKRLQRSAKQVVWSYPKMIEGAEHLPSPLIPSACAEHPQPEHPYQTLFQHHYQQAFPLEWQVDEHTWPMPEDSLAPGGSGLLLSHQKCPLMALLDYRLGARYGLTAIQEGIQATAQGEIVHQALERFWQTHQTQGALMALSEEALQQAVNEVVTQAIEEIQPDYPEHLMRTEQSRIESLVSEWLTLEKQRPSFVIEEVEQGHVVTIGKLKFQIKIDRIDRVQDRYLLWDYKTGTANISGITQDPVTAPQLATYLFVDTLEGKPIGGLGYALLNVEGVGVSVIVEDEALLEGLKKGIVDFAQLLEKKKPTPLSASDWQDYLHQLKMAVVTLAEQIAAGEAPMQFDKKDDLNYANSALALRLPEALAQRGE